MVLLRHFWAFLEVYRRNQVPENSQYGILCDFSRRGMSACKSQSYNCTEASLQKDPQKPEEVGSRFQTWELEDGASCQMRNHLSPTRTHQINHEISSLKSLTNSSWNSWIITIFIICLFVQFIARLSSLTTGSQGGFQQYI